MLTLQKRKLEFSTQITHSVVFVTTHFRNIFNYIIYFVIKKKIKAHECRYADTNCTNENNVCNSRY